MEKLKSSVLLDVVPDTHAYQASDRHNELAITKWCIAFQAGQYQKLSAMLSITFRGKLSGNFQHRLTSQDKCQGESKVIVCG
jgi:hypothetical protein